MSFLLLVEIAGRSGAFRSGGAAIRRCRWLPIAIGCRRRSFLRGLDRSLTLLRLLVSRSRSVETTAVTLIHTSMSYISLPLSVANKSIVPPNYILLYI